jgi:hypothetical protein
MSQLISEILEKDATGDINHIYSEVRRLWGVPNVTTIVRHVASIPGTLEWLWAAIGPANECGDFQKMALALVDTLETEPLTPLPEVALRAMGVNATAEEQIQDVYAAYDRNNRPNILFVCVLQRLLAQSTIGVGTYVPQHSGWTPPPMSRSLVSMVQADEMDPDTLILAQTVGSWGFPVGTGFLPGVYRHLANWPPYLAHVGAVLWPYLNTGEILRAGASITRVAEVAADELFARLPATSSAHPSPTPEQAAAMMALLNNMKQKIPEMILICKLLSDALPSRIKE